MQVFHRERRDFRAAKSHLQAYEEDGAITEPLYWVGACPGEEESAGVNRSKRSPKGNRQMRRILNQAANAAVKHKGSIFEIVYRRLVLRLGHNRTIGAIAHRLCELIWIILHNGVHYEERGPTVCEKTKRVRTSRMIRTLRALGYRVEPAVIPA
jgi:transposase